MNRSVLLASVAVASLCLARPVSSASPGSDVATASVVSLNVDEAVARALEVAPRLARLAAAARAATADESGARAERWPQLELGASYQRRSSVTELSIVAPTQDPTKPVELITIFPNIQDNYRLRAGLSWPVFTGGRVASRIDAAGQSRLAAERDTDAARADLMLEVKSAYWGLVTARESVRVLQEAIRAFEAHLEDARNRQRFGMAASNEVLAVQVERDRAELERLRAAADADVMEANLRRLLDLAPTARVETREPLASAPGGSDETETLVAAAQAARPERAALAARVAAAEAAIGVEHGARLPQVALSASYNYANPNRDIVPPQAKWQDTWDVGVGVSWSVFDGGRRSAAEARAQAQADATRDALRELDQAIRLEVTRRVLERRTAEARVAVAERGLEAAQENRRVAADRYREGVIPSSELLDAETALERASLARTEALTAVRLATAALDRAVGR